MKKKKISDTKLLQEFESGKTLEKIGEEYGFGAGAKQTLSNRLQNLKNYKYRKSVKLNKSGNSNTRVTSIPENLLKEIGVDPNKELRAKREADIIDGKIILDVEEVS